MANSEGAQRSTEGIVLSIHRAADGRIRLVIDDVIADSDQWPQTWTSHRFFTRNDYDAARFLSSDLTEEQLAEIGANVVARLSALSKRD